MILCDVTSHQESNRRCSSTKIGDMSVFNRTSEIRDIIINMSHLNNGFTYDQDARCISVFYWNLEIIS